FRLGGGPGGRVWEGGRVVGRPLGNGRARAGTRESEPLPRRGGEPVRALRRGAFRWTARLKLEVPSSLTPSSSAACLASRQAGAWAAPHAGPSQRPAGWRMYPHVYPGEWKGPRGLCGEFRNTSAGFVTPQGFGAKPPWVASVTVKASPCPSAPLFTAEAHLEVKPAP